MLSEYILTLMIKFRRNCPNYWCPNKRPEHIFGRMLAWLARCKFYFLPSHNNLNMRSLPPMPDIYSTYFSINTVQETWPSCNPCYSFNFIEEKQSTVAVVFCRQSISSFRKDPSMPNISSCVRGLPRRRRSFDTHVSFSNIASRWAIILWNQYSEN